MNDEQCKIKQFSFWLVICTIATFSIAFSQRYVPLHLLKSIPMPNVHGRIDHMALDLQHMRLFVAALGSGTLEVLDLPSGKVSQTVTGLKEPQGVLYVQDMDRLFVATGGDGKCYVYSGIPLRQLAIVAVGDDADNVRYDKARKRLYVGYGNGAIVVIDPSSLKRLGEIKLAGHPESFQLEETGSKIFVNVPLSRQIAVLDRSKEIALNTWSLESLHSNYPMAFNEALHRVFIATRSPAKLVVLDSISGKIVSEMDCAGDADDLFCDSGRKLVYVSCGEGFIDIFSERDPDHYRQMARIPTAPGARTSLWSPQLNQLFLAVPARGGKASAVWIYQTR